jgi:hypothetical protein
MGEVAEPGARALEAPRHARAHRRVRAHATALRKDFADSFRKYAGAGKADLDSRGCEMPVCMPDQYLKQGYKVAARASYQIWLVHPSGRWRYLFGGHPTSKPPEDEVPSDDEPPIEDPPEVVDPPPDDLLVPDAPPIDYSRPRP